MFDYWYIYINRKYILKIIKKKREREKRIWKTIRIQNYEKFLEISMQKIPDGVNKDR